ncbi:uncharacterized protein METZ01_LOCUS21510 [marine metagenome]|uniref:Uncharacterized protein n=1 Tax=marine metagenome TaxID=408172 RepID=A0A381PNQ8_9ZZZZ
MNSGAWPDDAVVMFSENDWGCGYLSATFFGVSSVVQPHGKNRRRSTNRGEKLGFG